MNNFLKSRNKSVVFGQSTKKQQPAPESASPRLSEDSRVLDSRASQSTLPRPCTATIDLSSAVTGGRSMNRFWSPFSKDRQIAKAPTGEPQTSGTSSSAIQRSQIAHLESQSGVRSTTVEDSALSDRENLRKSVIFPIQQTKPTQPTVGLRRNISVRPRNTPALKTVSNRPSEPKSENFKSQTQQPPHLRPLETTGTSHASSSQVPENSQKTMPPPSNSGPPAYSPRHSAGATAPAPKERSGFMLPFRKEMNNSAAALQNNIASAISSHRKTDSSGSKKHSSSPSNHSEKALSKASQPQPPDVRGQETAQGDNAQEVIQLRKRLEELDAENASLKSLYNGEKHRVYNLQNAIASQKMSNSHMVQDDGQYEKMFENLDGSINELAFQIRKEWVDIPPWLKEYVHEDATVAGSKEMIAVGRALLSRFVHDEIFQRYLHPGIYEPLSKHLKRIDLNLRSLHMGPASTDEGRESGSAYIATWRAATLEGLSGLIQRDGQANKTKLAKDLTQDFLERMKSFIKSPAPQFLEAGVQPIIELALDVVEYKAYETRDIQAQYYLPNQEMDLEVMTKDTSLPPLLPIPSDEGKKQSKEAVPVDDQGKGGKKRSTLSAIRMKMHGTKETASRPNSVVESQPESSSEELLANRMRFAAFFAVAVISNGKPRILYKAPVFPFVA